MGQRKTTHFVFLHPLVLHRPHFFREQLHLVDRNVGQLGDVVAAAQCDVGVHSFHPRQFVNGDEIKLAIGRFARDLATDLGALDLREWQRADVSRRADQRDRHFIRHIKRLDQHCFVAFESGGILHQQFGQLIEPRIVHKS